MRQRAAEVLVMNEVAARLLALADGSPPVSATGSTCSSASSTWTARPWSGTCSRFAAELAAEGILESLA